jgi:hypothetical protein
MSKEEYERAKAAMEAGRLDELSAMQAEGFDVNATSGWAWRACSSTSRALPSWMSAPAVS